MFLIKVQITPVLQLFQTFFVLFDYRSNRVPIKFKFPCLDARWKLFYNLLHCLTYPCFGSFFYNTE
uniref:SFRICE_029051 n=1 Tax=Spodoptera frugiperda TaxID=7108 RepID=A0A2H1VG72_SPOFR